MTGTEGCDGQKSEGGGTCASGTSCTYSGLWIACHLDCPVGQLARERKTKTTTRAQWVTRTHWLLIHHCIQQPLTSQSCLTTLTRFFKHHSKLWFMAAVSGGMAPAAGPVPCRTLTSLSEHFSVVLTVHIARFLLARLLVLVERELAGKEVLSTLVIEGLLRTRRKEGGRDGGQKEKKRRGERKVADVEEIT